MTRGSGTHPWTPSARRKSSFSRVRRRLNATIYMASVITIAVVICYFASRPALRVSIDATKTRAYSLSRQSTELLDSLDGEWLIALLLIEENLGDAERRQLDEVLRRYTDVAPNITVSRIDPTDPQTLDQYESLLGRLRLIYADEISQYDAALDEGEAAFERLTLFAQQQSRQLGQVLQQVAASGIDVRDFEQRVGLFSLLAEQGGKVLEEVDKARAVHDAQPIADYETARSILAEALSQWTHQLVELAAQYEQWAQSRSVAAELRAYLQQATIEYTQLAQDLATAADPLRHLSPIELAAIGRQLKNGEAAVVVGPDAAAVIPSAQLLPRVSRGGALAFDRRFRGEQLISATIRSLLVPNMPIVVFVHNEPQSMLRRQPKQADLLGVATLLDISRFEVREWIVGEAEPPEPRTGQNAVWIIIPPSSRQSLNTSRRELELVETAARLIERGEPVLLNVYPSLLPGFNQPDPWAQVTARLGVEADTGAVIVERFDLGEGQSQIERAQVVQYFWADHRICEAVHGQQTFLPLPVPLQLKAEAMPTGRRMALATIDPAPNRWREQDWAVDPEKLDEPTRDQRFFDPQPIIVAGQRPHPDQSGVQRFVVVGSVGWLMSYAADAVTPLGGGRVALTNPGNQELLLASVAWLADMDELIAPSAVSQQVARLDGITRPVWLRWFAIAAVGAPIMCLVLGGLVWTLRRI